MTTKMSKIARAKINTALKMLEEAEKLLKKYCPPCPSCCPPLFPCNPGELANHGLGEIFVCHNCMGRGYIIPEDEV